MARGWTLSLAVVAGLQPSEAATSIAIVVALTLCGALVRRSRPGGLMAALSLIGTAVLAVAVLGLSAALRYGWSGGVRRGTGTPTSARAALARVLEPAQDLLRQDGVDVASAIIGTHIVALALGVALAIVVAGVRLSTNTPARQTQPSSGDATPAAGADADLR